MSVYLREKSLNFKNKVLSQNLINYFGIVVFVILLILSFKAYNLMTSMYIWDYRSKAFGDTTEASVLFGSQINRILYSLLVEAESTSYSTIIYLGITFPEISEAYFWEVCLLL